MIPILTFCGSSGSGKTTFVVNVIRSLSQKGYNVATIKHDGHGHDISPAAGDSGKHRSAGAKNSVVVNKNGFLMDCSTSEEISPFELALMMPSSSDIIICEGFKSVVGLPKIEVHRDSNSKERTNIDDTDLIALVTDTDNKCNLPTFDMDDHEKVANFIEELFIKPKKRSEITLIVNGEHIPTKDFINEMLTHSINGLIRPLKGCKSPKEIIIKAQYHEE